MALDADVLADIEEWAGPALAGEDYDATYNRKGTAVETAFAVLRRRRAILLTSPGSIRIEGDFAQDNRLNIETIDKVLAQLEPLIPGAAMAVTTGQLVRTSERARHA